MVSSISKIPRYFGDVNNFSEKSLFFGKGEEMTVKDPYGLKARMLAHGLTKMDIAAILTERGFKAGSATISRAINGDSTTHSSNVRVAMITYFKEIENGKTARC